MKRITSALCSKRSRVIIFTAAGVLSGLEALLPFLDDAIPRGLFALLSMVAVGGGVVARLLAQKEALRKEADE